VVVYPSMKRISTMYPDEAQSRWDSIYGITARDKQRLQELNGDIDAHGQFLSSKFVYLVLMSSPATTFVMSPRGNLLLFNTEDLRDAPFT